MAVLTPLLPKEKSELIAATTYLVGKFLNRKSVIVEAPCTDAFFALQLKSCGFENYIGLAPDAASLNRCVEQFPAWKDCFHTNLHSPEDENENRSVDMRVMLDCARVWPVPRKGFRNLDWVMWYVFMPSTPFSVIVRWCYAILLRRFCRLRFGSIHAQRFISRGWLDGLVMVGQRRKRGTDLGNRFYVGHPDGLKGVFEIFHKKNIRYVVLRWFECLPAVKEEEDVDVLVADEHLHEMRTVLQKCPGSIPIDIYSVSGLPGSDYNEMAYFPPALADEILLRRVMHRNLCYTPDKFYHFISLAYHALYHKGERSGLPSSNPYVKPVSSPGHPYAPILHNLASESNTAVDISMESLHEFLLKGGWAPPKDTMEKLAQNNFWVRMQVDNASEDIQREGELMVFVLRDYAMKHHLLEPTKELLRSVGLDVLAVYEIGEEEKKLASQHLRGGNWSKGSWPKQGGLPACAIVAFDYTPISIKEKKRKNYPLVKNEHFFVKHKIRKLSRSRFLRKEQANFIHSSDNETIAWEYLSIIMPEKKNTIERDVAERRRAFQTQEKVLWRIFTNGKNAKVEVVEWNGRKCVKKTYKPGRERFLEREKLVMREFGAECPFIPPLLEEGSKYVIFPFYENKLSDVMCSTNRDSIARDVLSVLKYFHSKGYAIIDFHPGNFLWDASEGLKVVDFEFLYPYKNIPPFHRHYDIAGVPKNFDGDYPLGVKLPCKFYKKYWETFLGISRKTFLSLT